MPGARATDEQLDADELRANDELLEADEARDADELVDADKLRDDDALLDTDELLDSFVGATVATAGVTDGNSTSVGDAPES